jgi:hypothetical protein
MKGKAFSKMCNTDNKFKDFSRTIMWRICEASLKDHIIKVIENDHACKFMIKLLDVRDNHNIND